MGTGCTGFSILYAMIAQRRTRALWHLCSADRHLVGVPQRTAALNLPLPGYWPATAYSDLAAQARVVSAGDFYV